MGASVTPLSQAIESLFARTRAGIHLDLQPTRQVLQALGNPQNTYPCVVIAGTNGKGSTACALTRMLIRAGLQVGLYTSPHLLRFSERIRFGQQEATETQLQAAYEAVCAAERHAERQLTFFEFTTCMALWLYGQSPVDIAVLEVGMGGRLDATNVVDKTLSIITPIAFDHQAYLGNTLAAIAAEKAGIIQQGRPVVVAPQRPEAHEVIAGVAAQLNAPCHWVTDEPAQAPEFRSAFQRLAQQTAVAAAYMLRDAKIPISQEVFDSAWQHAVPWPGRYQWITHEKIPVLLDGAHNAAGIEALRHSLLHDPCAQRPMHLVASRLADRPPTLLSPLFENAATVALACLQSPRGASRAALHDTPAHSHKTVYDSTTEALQAALARARSSSGFVLVTGSLLLVGEALACLEGSECHQPPLAG